MRDQHQEEPSCRWVHAGPAQEEFKRRRSRTTSAWCVRAAHASRIRARGTAPAPDRRQYVAVRLGEWNHNLAEFDKPVADGGGRIGAPEQAQARLDAGGTTDDGTAILHGPDQVAGGRPDTFDGLGHSGTNSSLGSQWKSRIVGLQLDVRAVTRGMDPDLLRFIRLNTRLVP